MIFEDKLIKKINETTKDKKYKVVIPDAEDPKMIESLKYLKNVKIILVGKKEKVQTLINEQEGISIEIEIIEPNLNVKLKEILKNKMSKIKTDEQANDLLMQPNYYATLLLESGYADCLVGGSRYATKDILRPAFQIIKASDKTVPVSSFMLLNKGDETIIMSDCAINLNPTPDELAKITKATMDSVKSLGFEVKVAMLSYSTLGSGSGESVDKVREAYEIFIKEYPENAKNVIGEIQFDAANNERVASIKVKESRIAGKANIFIFPNLDSGNIGYKIAQDLGGYEVVGPLLQGINKPVNDLSRGAKPIDIAKTIYLTLAMI